MSTLEKLNVAIVGACGRGKSFKNIFETGGNVRLHAVCDINEVSLAESSASLGAVEQYTDFYEMLEKSELDAVIIATPMPFHAPQSIAALERGLSVLSEVTAAVSLEECRQLVAAEKASRGTYMMAENYVYMRSNLVVREMVRQGAFGTTYYAEGEYLHELKGLNEITVWRRKWQNGIDGITYGTHSLGPILQWMPGDRVVEVSCAGSGRHYKDPRGEEYAQDTSVMLCKMHSGGLVKIRVDMISDRPHAMTNYQLQGTDGCYESRRAAGENNRIWLRSKNDSPDEWLALEDVEEEFLPSIWREAAELIGKAGHGGSDYFGVVEFIAAIEGRHTPTIGIHEAMDMTVPGLISQEAIQKGQWLAVPDSREW